MNPGDRLFCLFVENKQANETFVDWPLHLTLVPWFRTKVPSKELGCELRDRLKLKPFEIVINGEDRFGAKRRLVSLVAEPTPLHTIQHEARDLLHDYDAWLVDETTRKRRPFRPHVTAQPTARLHSGDRFRCDALYIVEQKGGYKEIISKIEL